MGSKESVEYFYSESRDEKISLSTPQGYRKVQIKSIGEDGSEYIGRYPRSYIEDRNPVLLGFIKDKVEGIDQKFLDPSIWFEHTSIFGGRGTGKSTLLLNQMVSLAYSGHGFSFIDPGSWGDTAQKLIQRLPKNRLDDVVIIQPGSNKNKTVEINLLDPGECNTRREFEREAEAIKNDIKAILKDNEYWGPLMDGIFKNIFRGMMYSPKNYNIIDMYKILNNEGLRKKFAEKTKVDVDRYIQEYTQTIKRKEKEELDSLVRRIQDWYENPIVRKIVGSRKNTINIKELIENQKILVVNPSIDDVHAKRMIPTWIIRRIWNVIRSRKNTREIDRTPHFLFIDEFHSIYNKEMDLQDMLAQARKGKLGMFISTQNPSQLPEKIRKQLVAETQTIISFAVRSPEDAETISQRLKGIEKEKITNLDRYKAILATTVDKNNKKQYDTFYINTYPPYPPLRPNKNVEKIIDRSLEKYGEEKTKDTVETKYIIQGYSKTEIERIKTELRNDLLGITWSLSIKNHGQKPSENKVLEELKRIREIPDSTDIPKPKKYIEIENILNGTFYNIKEPGKKAAIKRRGEPNEVPQKHTKTIRKIFRWTSQLGITPKIQTETKNPQIHNKYKNPPNKDTNTKTTKTTKNDPDRDAKTTNTNPNTKDNTNRDSIDQNIDIKQTSSDRQDIEAETKPNSKNRKTNSRSKNNSSRSDNDRDISTVVQGFLPVDPSCMNIQEALDKKEFLEEKEKLWKLSDGMNLRFVIIDRLHPEDILEEVKKAKRNGEKCIYILQEKTKQTSIQQKQPQKTTKQKRDTKYNTDDDTLNKKDKPRTQNTETQKDLGRMYRRELEDKCWSVEDILKNAMSGEVFNRKKPIKIDRYRYPVVKQNPRWKIKKDTDNEKLITLYSSHPNTEKIDSGRPKGWIHIDDLQKNKKIPYNQFYNKVKKQNGRYIVETRNEKHKYKTEKELRKDWNIVRQPFIPQFEFDSKLENIDWSIIVVPKGKAEPLVFDPETNGFKSIVSSKDPRSKKLHDKLLKTACDRLIEEGLDIKYIGGRNKPDAVAIDKKSNQNKKDEYHIEAEHTSLSKPASKIESYLDAKQKNKTPIFIVKKAPENPRANAEKIENILQKSKKGKIYPHPNKPLKISENKENTKNQNTQQKNQNQKPEQKEWICLRHKTNQQKKHTWKKKEKNPKNKHKQKNQDKNKDIDVEIDKVEINDEDRARVGGDDTQNQEDSKETLSKKDDSVDKNRWYVLENKDDRIAWIDNPENPNSYSIPIIARKKKDVYITIEYRDKNGDKYSRPKKEVYTKKEIKERYSEIKKPIEAKDKIKDDYGIIIVDTDTQKQDRKNKKTLQVYKDCNKDIFSHLPKIKTKNTEPEKDDEKDNINQEKIEEEIIKDIAYHHLEEKIEDPGESKTRDIDEKELKDCYVISNKVYEIYQQKRKKRGIEKELNPVWFTRKLGNYLKFKTTTKYIEEIDETKRVLKGIKLKEK